MIRYSPENLSKLFKELDPKKKIQALKGASRKAATKVRKKAVENLRSSGLAINKELEKGVRKSIYKKKPGFLVTIGSKEKKKRTKKGPAKSTWTNFSYHTNSKGLKKPILIWAEEGTQVRKTRTQSSWFVRKKKGHLTGRMRAYRFMKKTKKDVKDKVTDFYRKSLEESIIQTVKKYGK